MPSPRISFEVFPPQSLEASFRLWETVQVLAPFQPAFLSVTYGAGGSTRALTQEAAGTLRRSTGLTVAAHLTCTGASQDETLDIAMAHADAGVTDIVALRGDAPAGAGTGAGTGRFVPHPAGFASSVALVAALAKTGRFTLRVGAYPERHPDAADSAADITWLKRKIDAGASSAITQFFFEADTFLRFRDACAKAGITAPIIPGILPITNWAGAKRLARRCGTSVPPHLDRAFATATRDGREGLLALTHCTALCEKLQQGGVEDLHFYTLNRPDLTRDVLRALGLGSGLRSGLDSGLVLEKVA